MSEISELIDHAVAFQRSRIRASQHAPFYSGGNCPISDAAGNWYAWSLICGPAWRSTLAVYRTTGGTTKLVGNCVMVSDDIALSAGRVVQDGSEGEYTVGGYAAQGRPASTRRVVAIGRPRTDVRYRDPFSYSDLVSVESSDIALLRLEHGIGSVDSVTMGVAPDAGRVTYLRHNPDTRCATADCYGAFADAVLCSYYAPLQEVVTPVQWVIVADNGSVLVAFLDYQPGAPNSVAGGAYQPSFDIGAPVISVGSSAIRPEVVGVVSGILKVDGAGVYYRITRVDRWSGWIGDTLRAWYATSQPTPPAPPAPGEPGAPLIAHRGGNLLLASFVLAAGTAGALALGR